MRLLNHSTFFFMLSSNRYARRAQRSAQYGHETRNTNHDTLPATPHGNGIAAVYQRFSSRAASRVLASRPLVRAPVAVGKPAALLARRRGEGKAEPELAQQRLISEQEASQSLPTPVSAPHTPADARWPIKRARTLPASHKKRPPPLDLAPVDAPLSRLLTLGTASASAPRRSSPCARRRACGRAKLRWCA
ncbi:hypothetical protein NUW54_g14568 [Trametes sanguinea]|uniref:Uncharacterized protein n=1 Tax=Trametes sanguinea TaxID=158606 RepID=A0ACC1MC98_9APHY|nr:hypothetical protein NUW54_g14568 [Trametes sanguinea]